jgi:hypothetical protein
MIEVGAQLPDATVFAAPGEPVGLRSAAEGQRAIYVCYLFDFSAT